MGWSVSDMLELGHRHADLEARRELVPLMATLVENPCYEFHPLGLGMSGGDRVRRYYQQFFDDFMQKIVGYELLDEWASESSVAQEYAITLKLGPEGVGGGAEDSEGELETHRVLGILFAQQTASGTLLGGERIYAGERVIRLMAGTLFDEFEPL